MYEPLHRHRPHHRWTNGDLAAKVGADLGLPPDDEQRWILDAIYGEVAPDRPSSFEVAVVSPRQNIKTSTFGIAALADLFVFGVERHLWTAHHGDTLAGTFVDFKSWITSNPEYEESVDFYEGHQDMSIRYRETGGVIDFQSRTGKAGRGLTGVKRITLDEALYLEAKHVGAVYPTMLTRQGAQVRIGSSAGLLASDELRRIRRRGRGKKDGRLTYVEYGAEKRPCLHVDCTHVVGSEGCALDDRDLWWQANCALWPGRIVEESIEDMRRSMPPGEFAREMLSWWEDPVSSAGSGIDLADWALCRDPGSTMVDPVAFGVAQSADRSTVSIAAVGRREDGSIHIELADHRKASTRWVAPRLRELVDKWGPVAVTVDPIAEALVREIEDAGVEVDVVKFPDYATGCGRLYDMVRLARPDEPQVEDAEEQERALVPIWHRGSGPLDAAIESATVKPMQRGWVWRQGGEAPISPLVAVTLALVGFEANDDIDYDIEDSLG